MEQDEKLKKYLKKKYYKNDEKVITLHIKDESELYNSLDSMKDTLSDSITDYIERTAETLLPLNRVKIKIDCKKKVDIENLKKCLNVHYGIENLNYERIDRLVTGKKTFLLVVALIVLSTFLFMDSLYEVRYFVATLALWEYIDMNIYTDEEDEIKKYIYEILEVAEIEE